MGLKEENEELKLNNYSVDAKKMLALEAENKRLALTIQQFQQLQDLPPYQPDIGMNSMLDVSLEENKQNKNDDWNKNQNDWYDNDGYENDGYEQNIKMEADDGYDDQPYLAEPLPLPDDENDEDYEAKK